MSGKRTPGQWDNLRELVFVRCILPEHHTRRPAGYVPLDAFWRRRGYAPVPGFTVDFAWRDLDETVESPKAMAVWMHNL